MLNIPKIFEDETILVINKPAGVVVNRAESVKDMTLQDWFEAEYPDTFLNLDKDSELDTLFASRSGMVHRLDKDTSGIMIWAKSPEIMSALMLQFKERKVGKTYQALVYDALRPETGSISLPLARSSKNRKNFGVVVGGKLTQTDFQVENYYKNRFGQIYTLVSLFPKTGRTHQLRVVLKHLKHPIVGDHQYVGKKRAKKDKAWCQRQFLHAKALKLTHPVTQTEQSWSADLSQDLIEVISSLEQVDL